MAKHPKLPSAMFQGLVVKGRISNSGKLPDQPITEVVSLGPPFVHEFLPGNIGLDIRVDAGEASVSDVFGTFYLPHIVCSVTSSQDGLLSIERFVDRYGLILHGKPLTSSLTANESTIIDYDDGKAFGSCRLTISNSTSAPSLLSGFILLLIAG